MKRQEIKYLLTGFSIGGLISIIFFTTLAFIPPAAVAQQSSPPPLFTAANTQAPPSPLPFTSSPLSTGVTATYTYTPTMSAIPEEQIPSATPTLSSAELLLATGELTLAGPLSREQQLSIYNAAITFIAPSNAEAKRMSVEINQLQFSDPSTTCGPLSLAILQRAGILGPEIVPHDFFLINPDLGKDRLTIKSILPPDQWNNTRHKVKINKEDWGANPLYPGDFLYIYAGSQGNFEHMLVVSRVDVLGRRYAVTNYNAGQGFIIDEVLLYDPADPNVGMFAEWMRRPFQETGSTGYGGYELWRLKQ